MERYSVEHYLNGNLSVDNTTKSMETSKDCGISRDKRKYQLVETLNGLDINLDIN